MDFIIISHFVPSLLPISFNCTFNIFFCFFYFLISISTDFTSRESVRLSFLLALFLLSFVPSASGSESLQVFALLEFLAFLSVSF